MTPDLNDAISRQRAIEALEAKRGPLFDSLPESDPAKGVALGFTEGYSRAIDIIAAHPSVPQPRLTREWLEAQIDELFPYSKPINRAKRQGCYGLRDAILAALPSVSDPAPQDHVLKVEMGEFTTYKLVCNLDDAADCHQVCATHLDGCDPMETEGECVREVYRNGCTIAEWVNDGGIESVGFEHTIEIPVKYQWNASHDYPSLHVADSPSPSVSDRGEG